MIWTILGGSSYYTPLAIQALLERGTTAVTEVRLWGRSETKLQGVRRVCQALIDADGSPLRLVASTDLEMVCRGADLILIQIRVGGMKARAKDESFPLKYGVVGEETVGPGGISSAWRTLPVVVDLVQRGMAVAPHAQWVLLTNPNGIVLDGLYRATGVRGLGLCDLPLSLLHSLTRALGEEPLPPEALLREWQFHYWGLNHLAWLGDLRFRGREVGEELLQQAACWSGEIDPGLIGSLKLFPLSYLKYIYHAPLCVNKSRQGPVRGAVLAKVEEELEAIYAQEENTSIPQQVLSRGAIWYSQAILPLLEALAGRPIRQILVQPNEGILSDLPKEAWVEAPAWVGPDGIRPDSQPPIPLAIRGLIQQIQAAESLAAQAAIRRDPNLLLQSLLAHPVVPSWETAQALVGEILG